MKETNKGHFSANKHLCNSRKTLQPSDLRQKHISRVLQTFHSMVYVGWHNGFVEK